jgi:hypothetical protein
MGEREREGMNMKQTIQMVRENKGKGTQKARDNKKKYAATYMTTDTLQ